MRPTTFYFDPTAGERAREISADPGAARPIVDATDPGYGQSDRVRSLGRMSQLSDAERDALSA